MEGVLCSIKFVKLYCPRLVCTLLNMSFLLLEGVYLFHEDVCFLVKTEVHVLVGCLPRMFVSL
jgi:hypothetical protein